jgi:hypothetical protein
VVRGFPDVKRETVEAALTSLGGKIEFTDDAPDGPNVIVHLDNSQIIALARTEGIRDIQEILPVMLQGEENAWNVIAGTYVIGQEPSLYEAGVSGSGGPGANAYKKDVDVAPAGVGTPPAAGAGDTDWNGNGILDNAAQIIADIDTGAGRRRFRRDVDPLRLARRQRLHGRPGGRSRRPERRRLRRRGRIWSAPPQDRVVQGGPRVRRGRSLLLRPGNLAWNVHGRSGGGQRFVAGRRRRLERGRHRR